MGTSGGQGAICPAGHASPGPGILLLVTLGRLLSEPQPGPRASVCYGYRAHRCLPPHTGSSCKSEQVPFPQALTSICQHARDPFPNPQGPGCEFCLWGLHPPPQESCSSGLNSRPAGEGAGSGRQVSVLVLAWTLGERGKIHVWGCSGWTAFPPNTCPPQTWNDFFENRIFPM